MLELLQLIYRRPSSHRCQAAETAPVDRCGLTHRAKYGQQCGIINRPDGCFSKCHEQVDPSTYFSVSYTMNKMSVT